MMKTTEQITDEIRRRIAGCRAGAATYPNLADYAATAQELVTRALRRLQAIDIMEEPSASEMTHGLAVFSELINGWTAHGITTETFTLTADTTDDDDTVKQVEEGVDKICIGLNVSGTGIPASTTVRDVITGTMFRISADATADGSDITLTFAFLPMPVRYEGAAVAMLARRLAPDLGLTLAADLERDAEAGWAAMLAGYIPDRTAQYDLGLTPAAATWDATTDTTF